MLLHVRKCMKGGAGDFDDIGSNDKGSCCTESKGVKPMAGLGIPTSALPPLQCTPLHCLSLP